MPTSSPFLPTVPVPLAVLYDPDDPTLAAPGAPGSAAAVTATAGAAGAACPVVPLVRPPVPPVALPGRLPGLTLAAAPGAPLVPPDAAQGAASVAVPLDLARLDLARLEWAAEDDAAHPGPAHPGPAPADVAPRAHGHPAHGHPLDVLRRLATAAPVDAPAAPVDAAVRPLARAAEPVAVPAQIVDAAEIDASFAEWLGRLGLSQRTVSNTAHYVRRIFREAGEDAEVYSGDDSADDSGDDSGDDRQTYRVRRVTGRGLRAWWRTVEAATPIPVLRQLRYAWGQWRQYQLEAGALLPAIPAPIAADLHEEPVLVAIEILTRFGLTPQDWHGLRYTAELAAVLERLTPCGADGADGADGAEVAAARAAAPPLLCALADHLPALARWSAPDGWIVGQPILPDVTGGMRPSKATRIAALIRWAELGPAGRAALRARVAVAHVAALAATQPGALPRDPRPRRIGRPRKDEVRHG